MMAEATGGRGRAPLKETTPESKPIRGTRHEEHGAGGAGPATTPSAGLPPELADKYKEVTALPRGSQAAVWRAKDGAGVDVAIKVYDRGFEANAAVLDKLVGLAREGQEHLVGLVEHGTAADGRLYEVQEYQAEGTLADLMERTGTPSTEVVRTVVRELAEALVYLHEAGIDHQDLKPSNVFVRSEAPLDLVLGDFGTSSQVANTVRSTKLKGMTWPYAPPEAFALSRDDVTLWRHKYDWWAVGMIVVEMLTGSHPLPSTGPLIATYFATRNLDDLVEGVRDPAWRMLCRGLLRRDPNNRWGAAKVQRWLQAPDDPALLVPEEGVPPRRGFRFVGKDYETARALGAAFADDWSSAGKVWTERNAELQTWLRDELGARDTAERLDEIDRTAGLNLDAQLFLVLRALDPNAPPSFQGIELTEEKLARLAGEAAPKPAERAGRVLRALHRSGALVVAEREAPALGALADSWAAALADYERLRRELESRGLPLTDVDRTLLLAAATPGSDVIARMRDRVRRVLDDKPLARDCEWFRPLGTVADAGGPALLAMTYLAEPAHAEGRARQQEAEQERRAARAERLAGARWGAAVGAAAGLLYLGAAAWGVGWPLVVVLGFVLGAMAAAGVQSSGGQDRRAWSFLIGGGLGAGCAAGWFWAVTRSFEQLGAWLPGSELTPPLLSGFVALGVGLGVLCSLPGLRAWARLAFTWTGGALGASLLTLAVSGGVLVTAVASGSDRLAGGEEAVPDAAATPAAVEQALALDAADRGRIQEALAVAGFDPGPVNGVFDSSTRAAIRDWQRAGGTAPTGYLDGDAVRTLVELQADDAAQQAEAAGDPEGSSAPGGAADQVRPGGQDPPPIPTFIREAERRAAALRGEELRRAAAVRDEELRRAAVVREDGLNADLVRSGPFGITIGNEADRPRRQRALASVREHHEDALSGIEEDHSRTLVDAGRDQCTSLLRAAEPSEAAIPSAAEAYAAAVTSAAAAHDTAVRTAADVHDDAVQATVEGRTVPRTAATRLSPRSAGSWDPRCR